MENTILIIDDEKLQAESLKKSLSESLPQFSFEAYSTAESITDAIENRFYNLAILDIRMDKIGLNGISIAEKIFEINPIAKVVIISAYREEYFTKLKGIIQTGKVLDVVSKEDKSADTANKLLEPIKTYLNKFSEDMSFLNASLLQNYSEAKNEKDTYKKGVLFERFIALIFGTLGYREIRKRVIDKSRNEVDLAVRNEIKDPFLNKFGKYILIECKNKPDYKVGKNDFIIFNDKLKNTNNLSEFGIIATTGAFAKTTYLEAMRASSTSNKVIFLSNIEFLRLIESDNKLEEFKKLIDEQLKN
ncbi:MAG TPA: response regulator [Sphingobacteriaceae bacterium]|nr:response regulator [Sphingobacteriaceae bacterium]